MSDKRNPDLIFYIKDIKNNKRQKIEAYDATLWRGSRFDFLSITREIKVGGSNKTPQKEFKLGEKTEQYEGCYRIKINGIWWPKNQRAFVSKQDLQDILFRVISL